MRNGHNTGRFTKNSTIRTCEIAPKKYYFDKPAPAPTTCPCCGEYYEQVGSRTVCDHLSTCEKA